jgi:glycopeptide antibiotics resistance protein
MIEWPIAFFILALILFQEIWGSGQRISGFLKKVWAHSVKSKSPSKHRSALLFASLAFICFAFWESILRLLLQGYGGVWLSILGAVILFVVMGLRSTKYKHFKDRAWPMRSVEWSAVMLGFALMIHGWIVALCLGGWVVWRSLKALPK